MRIGIDITALLPEATGVDTYLLELVEGLAAVDGRNSYSIFINREDRDRLRGLPGNFEVIRASTRSRLVRLGWQQAALPIVRAGSRLDVLHSPSFIAPLAGRRARHVLTIHDMTSFTDPELHEPLRRSRLYRAAIIRSIRLASLVCVPTRAVRDDVLRLVDGLDPGRIRVIHHGVSDRFRPEAEKETPAVRKLLGLPSSYLLSVGTIQPRKNLELLLEAYRRLVVAGSIEEDLVLAGRLGWGFERVMQLGQSPELRGRVHLLGYVDQQALAALYAGARALVYPSLDEGFGLPPLEAMACGVPVVASSAPALAENFSGAAELVPSRRPQPLADAITRVLCDEQLRERRRREGLARAKRFNWEQSAAATLACYEELVG